jgi:hypothetical protein
VDAVNGKTANIYITTHRAEIITSERSDSVRNRRWQNQGPRGLRRRRSHQGPRHRNVVTTSSPCFPTASTCSPPTRSGRWAGRPRSTASACSTLGCRSSPPVARHWGQVSPAKWKQLIAQGWRGKAGDKVEALPPVRRTAQEPGRASGVPAGHLDGLRQGRAPRWRLPLRGASMSGAEQMADRLTSLADSGKVGAASIRNLYTAAGRARPASERSTRGRTSSVPAWRRPRTGSRPEPDPRQHPRQPER